jgi:hypothetical protein
LTERKPAGADWEPWAEAQIREAQEQGVFDEVEGRGKPLADVSEPYDPQWWTKKLLRREGVSELPPALEMRRRTQAEIERLMSLGDEGEVRRGLERLDLEIRRSNATVVVGPSTSLAPLDIESLVDRWRRTYAEAAS